MNEIKTILFDFDGVMVNRFTELSVKDFCSAYGIKRDDFRRVSVKASGGLDTGQKKEIDYFSELIEKLSLKASPTKLQKFFSDADMRNIKKNERLYEWISHRAKEGSTILGLATNVSRGLAERLNQAGLYDIFLKRYFSYKVGATKTDKRFWKYVIDDLGVMSDHIVFIDDNKDNVAVAASVGIKGMVYSGFDRFLQQISPWIGE